MTSRPRPTTPFRELQELPNVGPRVAGDLLRLGITSAEQLKRRNPFRMYDDLCEKDGARHDPCLLDVFISVVEFANGKPARPWWHFTKRRKAALQRNGEGPKPH